MTIEEFTQRVGEEYANDYEAADKLYLALPTMNKDDFCAVWLADKKANLRLFSEISDGLTRYNEEIKNSYLFRTYARPFHTGQGVAVFEKRLLALAEALKTASKFVKA